MAEETGKLAIIAGGGALPNLLHSRCKEIDKETFIVAFEGQEQPNHVDYVANIAAIGKTIDVLKQQNVTEIIFVGRIKRPAFKELRPDLKGTKLIAKIGLKSLGDDGLLRIVSDTLEKEGFKVIAIQDILEEVLMPQGILTKAQPDEQALADIRRGREVARSLGMADVGQSVVIQQGLVIAVEAIEGTDALLSRVKDLQRSGDGGVLVKVKKPQQDDRLDLPTIGSLTIEHAFEAGLKGVAVRAGETLVADLDQMVQLADEKGLFIIGV